VAERKVKAVLRHVDAGTATVAVMSQVNALKDACVADGDEVIFVGVDPWEGPDPWAPDEVPWTHRESTSELAGNVDDDPSAGASDDSPDMTLDELAAVPVLGAVGPEDEPGVVL
jgi:hypothetical protein